MFVRLRKGNGPLVINTEHISLIEEIAGGAGGYHVYLNGRHVADLTKEEGDDLMYCMASDIITIGDPEE